MDRRKSLSRPVRSWRYVKFLQPGKVGSVESVCTTTRNDSKSLSKVQDSNGVTERKEDSVKTKPFKVGLLGGVAFIIGTVIGSGIFITPASVLKGTKSPGMCLIVWALCGVYSLFGALCYCEIGILIPKTGGEFVYYLEAFGPLHKFFGPMFAFVYIWQNTALLRPAGYAVMAVSFARHLTLPVLKAFDSELDPFADYMLPRLGGVLLIACLTYVHCCSIKTTATVQIVTCAAKLVAALAITIAGVYLLCNGRSERLSGAFQGSVESHAEIAEAFYGGLWAYEGWNALNFMTEELENPYRILPLAILIAVPAVSIVYVLINLSYFTVLSTDEILKSDIVVVEAWADKLMGPVNFIVPIIVLIAIFGTVNGGVFSFSWAAFSAAREGHLPNALSFVHIDNSTPVLSLLLNSLLACIYIWPSDVNRLIGLFGFTRSIIYFGSALALIVMRFTKSDAPRPFKVPLFFPIVMMLTSIYLTLTPIINHARLEYLFAAGFTLLGVVAYVPLVYYKKSLPGTARIVNALQKLFLVAPRP